ncbi:MAG: hypothetical protein HY958_09480 [Bacteroidia bacterium]|nr:hypothetical protein [Bacteroidia bacterium]
MNSKCLFFKTLQVFVVIGLVSLFYGCTSETNTNIGEDDKQLTNKIREDSLRVHQIFIALPSPIETAMMLKRAGAQYNEEFLNKLENVNKYSTSKQMALNLGVYSADLSYASLFDQNQTSIKYMAASKKLADKLGILSAIDQSIINRLENNVNNRDSIMQVISETFMNSNSYLKDNQRTQMAAMILAGGWIEGLYLSGQLVKTTKDNKDLITRIIDQKLSLKTLLDLLESENKVQNEDLSTILKDLNEIKIIFDQIKISSGDIEPVTDKKTNVTKLNVKTEVLFKKEDIDKLIAKVDVFRGNIIK